MEHIYNNVEVIGKICVAYGTFDGMHKGHLKVVETLVSQAKSQNAKSVLISLNKQIDETVLTTEEEKEYLLKETGLDILISYDNVDKLNHKEFIEKILIERLGANTIIVGKGNCFKKIVEITKEHNVQTIGCELVANDNVVITTEQVKQAVLDCDFEKVTQLCGHPYIMIGNVEHGKALGRTVGMPTANLGVAENKINPPSGVYATLTSIRKEIYKGLTNIGKRPSVDEDNRITIETFLLDFSKDIYGQKLVMEVYLYIRGVVKFANLEEVQNQVQKDLDKTKTFLAEIRKEDNESQKVYKTKTI